MRPEERYWLKVSLTIGVVTLVLLILVVFGLAKDIEHIFAGILKALE